MCKIPQVRLQLMLDMVDKPIRPIEAYSCVPADQQSQQPVEADEVIDMGMRDADVSDPLHLARGQRRDVAQIEQDGAALEQSLDIECRVSGSPIDQTGIQKRPHTKAHSGEM